MLVEVRVDRKGNAGVGRFLFLSPSEHRVVVTHHQDVLWSNLWSMFVSLYPGLVLQAYQCEQHHNLAVAN